MDEHRIDEKRLREIEGFVKRQGGRCIAWVSESVQALRAEREETEKLRKILAQTAVLGVDNEILRERVRELEGLLKTGVNIVELLDTESCGSIIAPSITITAWRRESYILLAGKESSGDVAKSA